MQVGGFCVVVVVVVPMLEVWQMGMALAPYKNYANPLELP